MLVHDVLLGKVDRLEELGTAFDETSKFAVIFVPDIRLGEDGELAVRSVRVKLLWC